MQLRIDYIEPGKVEAEEIAVLDISPTNVDWSHITPAQARQLKERSEKVHLPNGDMIEIKAHFHAQPPGITLSIAQDGTTLCSVFGAEIFGMSTRTRDGAIIGINVFVD